MNRPSFAAATLAAPNLAVLAPARAAPRRRAVRAAPDPGSLAHVVRALQAQWDDAYPQRLHAALSLLGTNARNDLLSKLSQWLAEGYGAEPREHSPSPAPAATLRIQVLGQFRLCRDDATLEFGAKPATRGLDILRILAIAADHTCSLEQLHDWLWPDADGDNAKAACDQTLHRLRKLLGDPELVIQREGKLRLARERVQVDLDAWELRLKQALHVDRPQPADEAELERVFFDFGGPLLQHERASAWSLPAAERVRSKLLDLAIRLGQRHEAHGGFARAQAVYLHALDHYPASARLYEALIRARLAQGDRAGALEDHGRFERIRQTAFNTPASSAIDRLVGPLLYPDA